MSETKSSTNSRVIRTPVTFSRFLLLLFLAGFSISGGLRVGQAILNQDWIERMRLAPGVTYFLVSGAIWAILFLLAFLAVLLQRKGAGWFTIAVALLASTSHWFERLAFAQSPLVNSGWIFEVIANLALLLILLFMMKGFPLSTSNE